MARTISSFLLTSCDEPTSAFSMKQVIMHGKMATTLLQQPDLDAPEHSRLINQLACPRAEDGAQKPSLRCGPTYGQESTRISSQARGLGMGMMGAPGPINPMSFAAFLGRTRRWFNPLVPLELYMRFIYLSSKQIHPFFAVHTLTPDECVQRVAVLWGGSPGPNAPHIKENAPRLNASISRN